MVEDISAAVDRPTAGEVDRQRMKRVILAGAVGTAIEYYDFTVYAFLAVPLAAVFFPSGDPTTGLLATLAVFAASFLIRPIGGVVLGHIADKHGRKPALAIAVIGMAISTGAIGFIPGYAAIGIMAPVLLVLARLLQALAAGGELSGAGTYVAESVSPKNRGFLTSTTMLGLMMGALLGSLAATVLNLTLTQGQIVAWGWRVPFFCTLPLCVVAIAVRRKMGESHKFEHLAEHQVVKSPAVVVFRGHFKPVLLTTLIALTSQASYYLVFTYLGTYFTRAGLLTPRISAISSTCTIAMATIAIPAWGKLSDKVGRKPVLVGSIFLTLISIYPLFILMSTSSVAAVIGQMAYGLLVSAHLGVLIVTVCELFPTNVRSTGFSLGFNFAAILGGGIAPYISTWLIRETGDLRSPSYFIICVATISAVAALIIKESKGKEL